MHSPKRTPAVHTTPVVGWPCIWHAALPCLPHPHAPPTHQTRALARRALPVLLQYSFSLTTFSPSGKLVQIEYALNAVAAGATSLGISATDGVVIATEKKLPSVLVDESTVQKIATLTPNIGVVYSGMGPDFRVLVRKARKTAQAYHSLYKEHIPVAQLVRETAAVMQEFTRERSAAQRPWGRVGQGWGGPAGGAAGLGVARGGGHPP